MHTHVRSKVHSTPIPLDIVKPIDIDIRIMRGVIRCEWRKVRVQECNTERDTCDVHSRTGHAAICDALRAYVDTF